MAKRVWLTAITVLAASTAVSLGLPTVASASGALQVLQALTADRAEVFTGDLLSDVSTIPADQAGGALDQSLAAAEELARQNPYDFAPAFLSGQTVSAQAVTAKGSGLIKAQPWAAGLATAQSAKAPVSLGVLQDIMHDVIALDANTLPGSQDMFSSFVQAQRNRVVIQVRTYTDELRTTLAKRYGADKVAIHVDPAADAGTTNVDGRQNDNTNFEGGSRIYTNVGGCTSGFQWYSASYGNSMVTAGHCTTGNGWVESPDGSKIGDVRFDFWANASGSVIPSGQSSYRGDISMTEVVSGETIAGSIHIGGSSSTSSARVSGLFSRYLRAGDLICRGGATTGEYCGFRVEWNNGDHRYSDGTLLRNGMQTTRSSACGSGGDSGGPLYIYNGSTAVYAAGIHSGSNTSSPCKEWGTDLQHAYYSLPGSVKTS